MKKTKKDGFVLHHQIRIGTGRRPIRISKIRTMAKDSKHISKIAKILRKSHLDELPQIINWLKGEIKFVGPRPLLKADYRNLPTEYKKIYDEVGPGLLPIEYACKHYPPSKEELLETANEFHKEWRKNKKHAYRAFAKRIMRNAFGKEV